MTRKVKSARRLAAPRVYTLNKSKHVQTFLDTEVNGIFANVLLKYLFCDVSEVISLCVDDLPLWRSAFKHLLNSCVSPLYVQYSCWRLTAYVLPVFNLMFKCHGGFFRLFLWFISLRARRRSLPALSLKCPASFSRPRISLFRLKKKTTHSAQLLFLSFIIFPLVYAWDTFCFFQCTDRLNKNGLICAFFLWRKWILTVPFWEIGTMTDEGESCSVQIWCWCFHWQTSMTSSCSVRFLPPLI